MRFMFGKAATDRIRSKSPQIGFLALVAASVLCRLIAFHIFGPYRPHFADPFNYLQLAQSLDDGNGLAVDDPNYGHGLRAFFPPLYPSLLGAFGLVFGFSGLALILMNTLLDVCTAAILLRHDIRAAAIFILWPWNILGSFVAQKESLVCFLAVVLAEIAVRHERNLSPSAAALFGVCSAALVLTQPALGLFPIILAAMFLFHSRRRFKGALIACFLGLLMLVPWWVRNWSLWGTFVPLSTSAGASLAVVVNRGHYPPPPQFQHLPEPARYAQVGRLAVQHLLEHPVRYLRAVEEQVFNSVFQEKFALSRVEVNPPSKWQTDMLAALNWALLAIAAFGRSKQAWRLFLASLLSLAPAVWLEFGERHRYFLLPFIALLAADSLRSASAFVKRRYLARVQVQI